MKPTLARCVVGASLLGLVLFGAVVVARGSQSSPAALVVEVGFDSSPHATRAQEQAVIRYLRSNPRVASWQFTSKEAAFKRMTKRSWKLLDNPAFNPFAASITVRPTDPIYAPALVISLRSRPGVQSVRWHGGSLRPELTALEVKAARKFDRFPLYWVGERFEGMDLQSIDLFGYSFVSLIYGTCEAGPGLESSCAPPLVLQIRQLCDHLEVVTPLRNRVRGAPLGTSDGAPVLLTNRVQVKVYGLTDRGLAMRTLEALRSLNLVAPVVGPNDRIPGAPAAALAGTLPPCDAPPPGP